MRYLVSLGLSLLLAGAAAAHPGHGETAAHRHVGPYYVRLCDGKVFKTRNPQALLARTCAAAACKKHHTLVRKPRA